VVISESTEKENRFKIPSSSELLDQQMLELREEAQRLEAEIQLLEQEGGACDEGGASLEGVAVHEGVMKEMVDEFMCVGTLVAIRLGSQGNNLIFCNYLYHV